MKQTVVLTAEFPDIVLEILAGDFEVIRHASEGVRTEDEMMDIVADADGIITLVSDPVTRKVLAANPNLRVVGNYAVGVNNIDLDAARELGIAVTHTPDVLTDATADLTLALILAVTRRIVEGDGIMRRNEFRGWQPLYLLGTGLTGKRLGIVGMGRIGSAVARRAKAFGMQIGYFGRSRNARAEEDLGASPFTLEDLLGWSHIVSLHTPLTPETHHIIDSAALRRMRRDAYLINTARGPLVDEEALAGALQRGELAGAGLDVFEGEPEIGEKLLASPRTVLVPHIGSATIEARREMARIVAGDVRALLLGRRPKHPVVFPEDASEETGDSLDEEE